MNCINDVIMFLSSYKLDYSTISEEYLKQWANIADHICAIFFALLSSLFSVLAYKMAAIKFKKRYPSEMVIYTVKNSSVFVILLSLIWGGCFGRYMLAPFWFQNFYKDGIVSMGQIIDYMFFFIATCFIIYRFSIIYVLSDKRIELMSAYAIFNIITKKISIAYADIKQVKFNSFLFFETLEIIFKKGGGYDGISCFTNLKKAEQIINKQIQGARQ